MMTIKTWFLTPEGERGAQVTTYQNRGGWASLEAFKRDRLKYYRSRDDLYVEELPNGLRLLKPMRGAFPAAWEAQEVTIA